MEINVVDTIDTGLVKAAMMLSSLNQVVIEVSAGPNGVDRMVTAIINKVKKPNSIDVLRIYAHGNTGIINVAGGQFDASDELSAISMTNLPKLENTLNRLTPYFTNQARVELLGCEIVTDAKGKITENSAGERLIKRLAQIWKVNVLASGNPKGLPLGSLKFHGLVVQSGMAGGLACVPAPDVTKVK